MTNIIPFEYKDVAEDIKQRWRDKGYDVDSNTSNTAILTDLMAYAINMVNTNMSFGLSDITLNSSEQRKNILSLARQIGYEATLRKSFQYKIYLNPIEPTELDPQGNYRPVTIAKYSEFNAGATKFYYLGDDLTYTFSPTDFVGGVWQGSPIEIIVKEGTLIKYENNPLLKYVIGIDTNGQGNMVEETYIDIPYKNIEEDGVFVYVTPVNDQGNELSQEWFKRQKLIIERNEDFSYGNEFLQLRNIDKETVRIYFKFAGMGNNLLEDTKIDVNILISSGEEGAPDGKIDNAVQAVLGNFLIDSTLQSDIPFITGSDEESDIEIKNNAPMFFNSGNRLVTAQDYKTFIESNALVKNAFIWGGEDELVQQLGNVWFSILSDNISKTFTNVAGTSYEFTRDSLLDASKMYVLEEDINTIKNAITPLKIITIELNDRQPVFVDFFYEIEIARYTSINKQYVHDELFTIMRDWFFTNMEQYDVYYYNSTLIKKLDVAAGDGSGFDHTFTTKMNFYREQIRTELLTDKVSTAEKIVVNLGVNEQKIYGVSDVIVANLPSIYSTDFKNGAALWIDFANPITNIDKTNQLISFDIYLGELVCGTYYFVNTIRDKSIRIEINVDGTLLVPEDFNTPITVDVDFKSNNFKFIKNTVPRLAGVKFI